MEREWCAQNYLEVEYLMGYICGITFTEKKRTKFKVIEFKLIFSQVQVKFKLNFDYTKMFVFEPTDHFLAYYVAEYFLGNLPSKLCGGY